jgi:hypothetical protein
LARRRKTAANVVAGKRLRRKRPPRKSRARRERRWNDREPNALGLSGSHRNARLSGNCPCWRKNDGRGARTLAAPSPDVKNLSGRSGREMKPSLTNPGAMISGERDIGVTRIWGPPWSALAMTSPPLCFSVLDHRR